MGLFYHETRQPASFVCPVGILQMEIPLLFTGWGEVTRNLSEIINLDVLST